ncbi:MAG: MATE family efflux transporter [Candidatus Aphodosoma sp.]
MAYSFSAYKPFYRRNLKVAGPIVLSQVGTSVVQLVDTFMVGRLGTAPLAAVSFASAIFMMGMVFANGLVMSVTPIIGQLFAGNNRSRIKSVIINQLVYAVGVGAVIMSVLLCIRYLMPYMGQSDDVMQYAVPYYIVVSVSLLPNIIFLAVKQIFEGLGNTSVAMVITIVANIVNIIFNYLLIFGKCGFPEMGMLGAGVSTLLSRILMPVMFLAYLLIRDTWKDYFSGLGFYMLDGATLKELWSVGLPIAFHMVLEMSAFAISAVMMGWFGAVPLASHQIAINISSLLYMVVLGISAATTIRVSHQYGAHDYYAMRMAANASIHICLLANAVMGALIVVFRREIAMLFSQDPAVISLGSSLIVMAGIYQLSDGMQTVGAGILRGLKDVQVTMYVAFLAYIVINLPLGYLMAFVAGVGPVGIWIGFIGGLSVAALLFRIRYLYDFRRIRRDFADSGYTIG